MRAARTFCQEDVNTEIKMARQLKKVRGVQGKFKGGRNIFYSAIGGQPSRVIPLKTDLDQRRLARRWGETLNKDLFLNLFFSQNLIQKKFLNSTKE